MEDYINEQHRYYTLNYYLNKIIWIYIEKLKGLSPLDKLNQGYAYVSDEAGKTVTDVNKISVGDKLSVYVKNGRLEACVTGKEFMNKQ